MQTHAANQPNQAKQQQTKQQQTKAIQQPTQLVGEPQSEFVDNRPEVAESLQLRQLMDNSHQVAGARALQAMMNNSAQAGKGRALQAMLNNSTQVHQAQAFQCMGNSSARENTAQLEAQAVPTTNNRGLPNQLKAGIESLSGISMDHVKVHYNSSQPAQLNAHAYAQGSEIHVAAGQEQHVPHEAWHVVQQAQGRVRPTMQMQAGVGVNDDAGLESEADLMGAKALGLGTMQMQQMQQMNNAGISELSVPQLVQRAPLTTLSRVQHGESSLPIQRATEDLTLNGKTSTVATSMTATLDPTNPPGYGQGSSEDSDLDGIMGTLPTDPAHTATKKFVKGHLLNDNLGGMANKNNLYPITGQANKDHLTQVESKIKDYIDGGVGAKITYTVNVTNRSVVTKEMKPKKVGGAYANIDTPKATFDCTTTGGTGFTNLTNKQITSEAETRS